MNTNTFKIARFGLLFLLIFLASTAVAGGFCLVVGFYTPPVEDLAGSVFNSYVIPGFVLMFLVGGSALLAFILLLRCQSVALSVSTLSGIMIICFEFVQILIIGSPQGVGRNLQITYFGIGLVLIIIAEFMQLKTALKKYKSY